MSEPDETWAAEIKGRAASILCEAGALCGWPAPNCNAREGAEALYQAGLLAARSTVPEAGKAVVKPLPWEEIHRKRSDEDPSTEVVGWEADAGFAAYYTVELTGGGASMTDPDYDEKHFDDPEAAIAAAQADFEQRVLSALASVVPSGAEPAAWMVLRKGNLHLPVLTSKEDAVRYQQYNPEETLQPLYASPQPVAPTGEIAGLVERLKSHRLVWRSRAPVSISDMCEEAAAALTASEAEAADLRRKLEETELERDRLRENVKDLGDRKRVTGHFRDEYKARAESAERKLEEHRRALAEAREHINRYADTAAEHDLMARIDALEDKP